MKKKLLFGSIIAIILLIGVSFTSTVGISRDESYSTLSPLFQIRREGITAEANNTFVREYIGKQKEITIPLPPKIEKSEFIERFIRILNKMDDKTFESFIDVFTTHLALNNIYLDHSKKDISIFLNQLKNQDEKEPVPPTYFTCFGSEPFPCLKDVIEMLLFLIDVLLLYFLSCLKTTLPTIK